MAIGNMQCMDLQFNKEIMLQLRAKDKEYLNIWDISLLGTYFSREKEIVGAM